MLRIKTVSKQTLAQEGAKKQPSLKNESATIFYRRLCYAGSLNQEMRIG